MLKRLGVLALLTGVLLAGKVGFSAEEKYWRLADETVAVVNAAPVLYSDVKLYQLLFNNPSFRDALDKVITIEVVAQYAQRRGLTLPPQKVNEIIQNFAKKQGLTVTELYQMLEKQGLGGAVFQNFIYKYNLYVGAVQLFVIQPLMQNKGELETLVAAYSQKAEPHYDLEILKVPLKVAEKHGDLLASLDFEKISKSLGVEPIRVEAKPDELSPAVAKVVKRLKKGQVDFAQEGDYIYFIKVKDIQYKTSPEEREKVIAKIQEEKIKQFVENLKREAIIKILDEAPQIYLPKGG